MVERFVGPSMPALLRRAGEVFGAGAVILEVRRLPGPDGAAFEVVAGDEQAWAELHRGDPASGMVPSLKRQARIALMGPTGAGKTTTLAKLATNPRVLGGRSVGFLCLDTYRIGAIEQLRTYAELAGAPFEVAFDLKDLLAALRRLRHVEAILVDLPGRSPRAHGDLAAVTDFLKWVEPTEVHLAIPAGLQPAVARRIVDDFRPHGITHLLATKLDEAPDDPVVFDLAVATGLPMRWITNGQEVPDDLGSAQERLVGSRAAARAPRPPLAGAA